MRRRASISASQPTDDGGIVEPLLEQRFAADRRRNAYRRQGFEILRIAHTA
jgi:hypothetical protein